MIQDMGLEKDRLHYQLEQYADEQFNSGNTSLEK